MRKGELRRMILGCLKDYPKTRNSDIELTVAIWHRHYPKKLKLREADGKYYVALDDVLKLPREDQIARIRRKIQSDEGRYLPTSESVVRKRRLNMEAWRKWAILNKPNGN